MVDMDVVRVGGRDLTRRNARRHIEGCNGNDSTAKKALLLVDPTHRVRVPSESIKSPGRWTSDDVRRHYDLVSNQG